MKWKLKKQEATNETENATQKIYMKDKRDKNATHTKCNEMQQTTKVKRDQSTNKMHPMNKL